MDNIAANKNIATYSNIVDESVRPSVVSTHDNIQYCEGKTVRYKYMYANKSTRMWKISRV